MKRSLIVRSIMLFMLLEVVTLSGLCWFFTRLQTNYLEDEARYFERNYRSVFETYEIVSKAIFVEVINKPDVLSLVTKAVDAAPAERDRLRATLQDRLTPTYKNLLQHHLNQLHFHLPDVSSFLRMHHPSVYGDSLVKVRPAVVLANQRREFVSGFEVGRHEAGFRFIFPLFQEKRFVGTVETSISYSNLQAELQRRFPGEYALLIKKSVVLERVLDKNQYALIDSPFSKQLMQERFLDALHGRHVSSEQIYQLANVLGPRIDQVVRTNKPDQLRASVQGHSYAFYLFPLTNVAGQTEAYLMFLYQDHNLESFRLVFQVSALVITLLVLLVCCSSAMIAHRHTAKSSLQ